MGSERTWGVTPVPDRLRTLSLGDLTLLWGNLGISLLVLVAGTYLAGLGLQNKHSMLFLGFELNFARQHLGSLLAKVLLQRVVDVSAIRRVMGQHRLQ